MDWITNPEVIFAFFTLTALEIVLGIDNLIFITILASRLPLQQQGKARSMGLVMAMATRILLLFCLTFIMRLTAPVFTLLANEISGKDIILILGGLFLMVKSTLEIYHEAEGEKKTVSGKSTAFLGVVVQIAIMDIIFSLDSVITAIGLVEQVPVMIAAIVTAVIFMMLFIEPVSKFVEEHPSIKVLALSFLMLVGFALIGDGFDMHIPKGYIYFAMLFSTFVQFINLRVHKNKINLARA